jgi:hypothetical protein
MERHHEPSLAADYLTRALEAFDDEPAELSTRLLPDTPEGRLAAEYLLAVLWGGVGGGEIRQDAVHRSTGP